MRLFYLVYPALTAAFTAAGVQAAPLAPAVEPRPQFNLNQEQVAETLSVDKTPPVPGSSDEQTTLHLTSAQLLQDPALLGRALDSSIANQNIAGVRLLLPLYRQLPPAQQDAVLALYAEALLARADGNYAAAVAAYRNIIAQQPQLTPVRVQLAVTLAQDQQLVAAQDQFDKIRAAEDVPPAVLAQVDEYTAWLEQQQSWSFDAALRYLHENNVNNAPAQREMVGERGRWILPAPQSARGVGYQLGAQKNQPLGGHWFWRFSGNVDGKFYWDNHAYDDLNVRLSSGPVYRRARGELALLPYYERRWFGTEPYSNTTGVRVQASHVFNPNWQGFAAIQYGRKTHEQRPFLDGNSRQASITALYRSSPQQYWFGGVDLGRETAQDHTDAYRRTGVRIGWEREWPQGISTSMQGMAAKRVYDGVDIFQIKREDKEYAANVSVWHRGWHWHGLTPRLTWSWLRVDSNHFLYGYQKNQVFIEVSKRF